MGKWKTVSVRSPSSLLLISAGCFSSVGSFSLCGVMSVSKAGSDSRGQRICAQELSFNSGHQPNLYVFQCGTKRSFLKEPFIQTNIKPVTNTTSYNFVFFLFRCMIEELTKQPACAVNMSCIAVGQVETCPQQGCDHYNNCCQLRMTHYLTHFDISCIQFKFVYTAPSYNSSHPKTLCSAS